MVFLLLLSGLLFYHMSKDTYYFSHDYNARADDKIKGLIRKHGMVGYGVFWSIVEDLYNNANALQLDYEGIAYDLRVDAEMVKSIINDFDLFCFENGSFGSYSIEKRLDERNSKSEKARQSAFKRWNKIKADANAMPTHSEGNAIKERKGKEIKDIKENNIIPLFEEFKNYALENSPLIDISALELKYKSWIQNSWRDGNNKKIVNWKTKLLNTIPYLNGRNRLDLGRHEKRVNDLWKSES